MTAAVQGLIKNHVTKLGEDEGTLVSFTPKDETIQNAKTPKKILYNFKVSDI